MKHFILQLIPAASLLPNSFAMEMQHGFIISDDDQFASHLVANGHRSHQLSASIVLDIPDEIERDFYHRLKAQNVVSRKTYFLFQAQKLNLPLVSAGQVLTGHIIESQLGDYQPKNVIVKNATITVKAVHINMENPFFK